MVSEHNVTDHDAIIRLQSQVGQLVTTIETQHAMSVERDTRIESKLDRINGTVARHEQEIRDMQNEDKMVTGARMEMWQRVETLWSERPNQEQVRQRFEFVERHQSMWNDYLIRTSPDERDRDAACAKQHDAMWSAFNVARFLGAAFLIEQPIILGALGILLTR